MSVRTDRVNLIVDVNGNTALNNLNEMKKKAADLRAEMQGLKKNTEEYKNKAAELKQVEATMTELKKTIGITALSQKELVAELNKLKALRGSVTPFSKEFQELDKQIKAVDKRLYDVKNGVQGFSSFWSKISDQVKQFGIVAAGYLGFQFITSQFQNILKGAGKLSDQLADLRRVAGLTAAEAQELNKQLSGLDTRTSTSGLREIAIIAGKLGVAKQDIFGFTQAVDQLVVALGDELGDAGAITDKLGKILNVFDGEINGDNISRLGNAFVELANTGAASGAFIADFDQRLAGIAQSAGISLGALSGLGAGLEELGARVESSSTAIQKLIISIAEDIPKAAKIAGMDVAKFNQLFADDPTEALLLYSQGLVKNKQSFSEVTAAFKDAGEEGARTIETITKLGTSADYLRGRIDLGKKSMEETTAITEAFRLKNETLGATLDKIGKAFASFITSSALNSFLKSIAEGFLSIITPAKTAVQQFDELNTKVNHLEKDIAPLLSRYDELKNKTALSGAEQVELNKIISTITNTLPGAATEFDKYGNAIAISTDRVREFIAAEKARLQVVNADALNDYQKQLAKTITSIGNIKREVDQISKTGSFDVFAGGSGGGGGGGTIRKATQKEIAETLELYKQLLNRRTGIDAEIARLNGTALDNQQKANADKIKDQKKTIEVSTAIDKDAVDKAKREAEKRAADLKKLLEDANKFEAELRKIKTDAYTKNLSQDQQEILAIDKKYGDLLHRAEKYYRDLEKMGMANAEQLGRERNLIDQAKWLELTALAQKNLEKRQKAEQSLNDANYKYALESQRNNDAQTLLQYKRLYAEGALSKKEYEDQASKLAISARENEIAVAERWGKKSKLAAKDVADFKAVLEKEGLDAAIKAMEDRLKAEEETAERSKKLQEERMQAIVDFIDEAASYGNALLNIQNAFDQAATNRENAALARDKRVNDDKKKSYKKLLDDKLISEEQYNRKVTAADEEMERKERVIKRRQAERDKQAQMYQAVINTFSAIAEALPNIPLSIAAGIAGFAQVTAISSQELPELGTGDWVRNGRTHAQGGINANIEKDEAVISAKAMKDSNVVTVTGTTAQITSALNSRAGGKSWASGAQLLPAWLNAMPPSINPMVPMVMARGGLLGMDPLEAKASVNRMKFVPPTDPLDAKASVNKMKLLETGGDGVAELVSEMRALRADVNGWNTKLKSIVVIKELEEEQAKYDAAKKASV